MRGARAKLLRHTASMMEPEQVAIRATREVALGERFRWVEVPDVDTGIKRFLARFALKLGIPIATRKERRRFTAHRIEEVKNTFRWRYRRLKKMFYRLRRAV